MDQPRRQRVSQLASRQTRVISGNRRRGYTSDDEEDASALRCGSIEDLGEDAIFPLQAGDHEDCEVIMSRAAKLTALEGLMLPSKVISRIVKADNKLRANRRAANRREENKKKLDAELNQAIAARLSQPRGHTVTGSHEDQFYVSREAFDKALESYDSLCKEYGEKPATTTTKADPTTTETDPTTTKTAHIIREQLIQLREQLLA
ncbi:hypothetical protein TGAMA5MH_08502 [Trichoderma gamsii]|uniref:Uncharacterized protein n=1 Tax=Trichoderma gamsii TaxID=398673 RepID=A0A2K0T1T2_9HYPO|nr:hypothetical protein TGAMA5MH_08502 [Trichoderma gamsii]